MRIEDLADVRPCAGAIAEMLVDGFRKHWPTAWPTREDALAEVAASLDEGRISRVALDADEPIGWISGVHAYDRVWELHPLVVRADRRRTGVGRALVADLEAHAARRGALTVMLGTNDDDAMTSIGGKDLYPNVLEHAAALADRNGHPFAFYRRLGYAVVGVIPDASAPGKPDILMAKRVGFGT